MKRTKNKKNLIKPLEVTSRYGNFNEYLANRFRDLSKNKSQVKKEPCLCASCERYCNTLDKGKCTIELQNEKGKKRALIRKHRSIQEKDLYFEIVNEGIRKKGWL